MQSNPLISLLFIPWGVTLATQISSDIYPVSIDTIKSTTLSSFIEIDTANIIATPIFNQKLTRGIYPGSTLPTGCTTNRSASRVFEFNINRTGLSNPSLYTSIGDSVLIKNSFAVVDNTGKAKALLNSVLLTNTFTKTVPDIKANAVLSGNTATISWVTKNEIKTSHFYVERSTDNYSFTSFADTVVAGNTLYKPEYKIKDDISNLYGLIYYRIRLEDINGNVTYSPVKMITKDPVKKLNAWPDPYAKSISVSFFAVMPGMMLLRVLDFSGRMLISYNFNYISGNNRFQLTNIKNLYPGDYFIDSSLLNGNIFLVNVIQK